MEVYESSKFTFAGIFAGIPRNTYVIPSISISCLKTPGNPWKIHYRNVKPWQIVTANFHTNTNSKSSNWKFAWNVIWKFIIFVFFSKLQFDFSQTQIWYGWMIREHFVVDRCVPGILVSLDVFSIWKALNELHIFGMHDEWLLNWMVFWMNEILLNLPCSVLAGAIGVRKLLRPSKNEKKS